VGAFALKPTDRELASMAFLWPALAIESASEFASALAREFVTFAAGPDAGNKPEEPQWTTHNRVVLELAAARLRDFSTGAQGATTLICAPFALHGATIVDLATRHSLVQALQRAGIQRLFVADWRSATPEMRLCTIDDYLAALNILIDEVGGAVDLVGLCQGGWMSFAYAVRFPGKVRKLVLAGAPIDIAAGRSKLSELASNTPLSIFNELVELGEGRVLGHHALQFWAPHVLDRADINRILEPAHAASSPAFQRLEARFRKWYAWTVDLPGSYYLQVVQQQGMIGPGPNGHPGRVGPSRAQQETDPLGRPLRGRDYGDDATVKVPGEIDVQRARRILEELRRRFGENFRPQLELDYIERLLHDY
jgi:poly(3-hydroxybutyrate) depolymerase